MKRRQFSIALGTGVLGLSACEGGVDAWPAPPAALADARTAAPQTGPASADQAPVGASSVAMGTNLSGMEWAQPGLRLGLSSQANIHFSVPRAPDVAYLARNGFRKNRLPIQWELLQPMLAGTVANAAAQTLIGAPGAFHAGYAASITAVLDAHAAVGSRCIIDLHNYGRYQDFRFQPDGAVLGLRAPPEPLRHLLRPYTSDPSQVVVRIMATAAGATLTQAHFNDFWRRAAQRWQGHPGLGGYGLMNEPHDLPAVGGSTAGGQPEDLRIWPTFAQAAIHAIRAVDALTPIYVSGNAWNSAMTIASANPGFPLSGNQLIYEVHMYLDALSNGAAFDWDTEVARRYSAGFGARAIDIDTGRQRIRMALDWAQRQGVKLALTETGMPIDDPRWQASFQRVVDACRAAGCEVYNWMGGNHWPIRNYAINHTPGWHQNKTLEPLVAGPMKSAAGLAQATLFDDGPGYALAGTPLAITVYARGHLAAPLRLEVTSSDGGTLSTSVLTIPAGANGQARFSYVPDSNRVSTLRYRSDGQLGGQVPPPRRVFSLTDPVAHAAINLEDAALALIAKYRACKWAMTDGHTDYLLGAPAAPGQPVRAVADSGYGSSPGNAMEMLNWANTDGPGAPALPMMRLTRGKKHTDHSAAGTWGFWCKKSEPIAGVQPQPRNRVPYELQDAHFALVALSVAGASHTGTVFQASKAEALAHAELRLDNSHPQARFVDAGGHSVFLRSPSRLLANTPAVLAWAAQPGAQQLRVNSDVVATASASFMPSVFNQMLIGWGFLSYYPRDGFQGQIYAVITGRGAPSSAELAVLERYLAATAGITF